MNYEMTYHNMFLLEDGNVLVVSNPWKIEIYDSKKSEFKKLEGISIENRDEIYNFLLLSENKLFMYPRTYIPEKTPLVMLNLVDLSFTELKFHLFEKVNSFYNIAKISENKLLVTGGNKNQLSSKISSWKDFCPELPLTDIVLIDPYYFCDYDQVSSNELIRSITLIPQNNPINIVLFCKKEADRGIDIMKEMQYIKETVKRNTSTKPNVTIVRMNDMHDRDLITNYFILSSGCGFDLQKKEIRINEKVTLYSMAYKQECGDTYNRMLCEYQESISKGKGEIIGDKKSNFLIF